MFKSWKFLIISLCWNVENSSGKDLFLGRLRVVCCVGNENGLLKRFWGSIHFHLAVNISSKCNSHSTDSFVAIHSLLLTKRIHYFFDSAFFNRKMKWHNQKYLPRCTFINHSLKHKTVIFADLLKHICKRVNFSKVRGLQPATLVTINTFTGICQGFYLIWTKTYLTNTSQWLHF